MVSLNAGSVRSSVASVVRVAMTWSGLALASTTTGSEATEKLRERLETVEICELGMI